MVIDKIEAVAVRWLNWWRSLCPNTFRFYFVIIIINIIYGRIINSRVIGTRMNDKMCHSKERNFDANERMNENLINYTAAIPYNKFRQLIWEQ